MNKLLILVTEDDAPVRNLITTTLRANDYRYITADTGEGAVAEAASRNPDIILLDLGLPDIDGEEVIGKIRSWSNVPIIVISARSEDSDKINAAVRLRERPAPHRLCLRLRLPERGGAASHAHRIPASEPSRGKHRKGADPPVHSPEGLGQQLGKRCGFPAGVYGDAPPEAGEESGRPPVYPDPYRHRVPDDEAGVSGFS